MSFIVLLNCLSISYHFCKFLCVFLLFAALQRAAGESTAGPVGGALPRRVPRAGGRGARARLLPREGVAGHAESTLRAGQPRKVP
jgi:hypothetical protein